MQTVQDRLADLQRQSRIQAGSLMATVLGDAVLPRGGRIWLGSLIGLLERLGVNERLVGCGATRRMPGEPETNGQPYGEIKRMFVHPTLRGQRIAERLLATLEARLLEDGLSLATLETGRDQTEAVRLYERCGYVRRAPFAGYPDNGLSVFYEKRLA